MNVGKLIHYGSKKYSPRRFEKVRNAGWIKPRGGLWTSPVDSTHSWKEWCRGADFRSCEKEPFFIIELKEGARIYKIETHADILKMPEYEDNSIRSLLQSFSRPSFFSHTPDFEKMCESWDAIWLTEKGEHNTRFSEPSLYGWDCETVLILNKKVIIPSLSLVG